MGASSLISRRDALVPLAAALAVPLGTTVSATQAYNPRSTPAPPPPAKMPDRYDQPLGIGLEGWPYPAPILWQPCMAGGQPVRMAYMDIAPVGRSRNQTVVLLHGRNFDSSYWAGPIAFLIQAGFRVLVPDQIGFHKSSKPDIAYSLDLLAQLTINLMSGLQIGQASVIGHSTGGLLAVRIAAAFPDHVDKLILEDPIGLVDYRRFIPPQATDTLVAAEHRRTVASYRGFMREYFPILPAAEVEPFVEWRMRVAQSGEYDRFCRATALTYQMVYSEPVRDEYDDIAATTLMIVGDQDRAAPLKHYAAPSMMAKMPMIPEAAADAVKDLKKGTLAIISGVGHVPHLEAPDAFKQKVLDFLVG